MEVSKILGVENPADLMTKILGRADIADRLAGMNLWIPQEGCGVSIGLVGKMKERKLPKKKVEERKKKDAKEGS